VGAEEVLGVQEEVREAAAVDREVREVEAAVGREVREAEAVVDREVREAEAEAAGVQEVREDQIRLQN
jgi:hypothetical protein